MGYACEAAPCKRTKINYSGQSSSRARLLILDPAIARPIRPYCDCERCMGSQNQRLGFITSVSFASSLSKRSIEDKRINSLIFV